MRVTLAVLTLMISTLASANERSSSGYYGLIGLGGSDYKIKNGESESQYRGWGYDLEAGVDLSWSKDFGFNAAALMQFMDLKNKSSGSAFSENANLEVMGVKAGLFFGPLTVGGGFKKSELAAEELSLSSGYTKSELTGDEKFIYANMTFNILRRYRSTAEITFGSGSLGDLKTTNINFFLRVGIIDFFGR